ncbi:putative Iron-sulfur cluster assembly scaffold protein SufE [Nitrospina gracilis 3/211]|uniref:Nitrogen fixation protein NifU n=1 Tax=Nitrospina gracilis (strain 3/211) TaxID=1266370 RepID=M1YV20_NITG3|nr:MULTISPECIES: NifU family protein [Nitrospina]MCF8722150.1 NifU-like protein [Nitrospina sp. Nb-3]CCQ89341.1 putative Iron-sulfur cluster assembly scaffold protein SufE [Nitrospina gracilis 3/211]
MSVAEEKFSTKFEEAATKPKHRGAFYQEDATEKGMALVEAKFKDMKLYWLVDVVEGRVYSAKFFAYGGKVSVGICEQLCSMVKGLTIDEACSLLGADVERALRDDPEEPAVPESKKTAFGNVPELLKIIKEKYPEAQAVAQATASIKGSGAGKPKSTRELTMQEQAWLDLDEADQIKQVELVLDEKVRPALMSDGGNIQVLEVVDGERVLVQYQGACGSCGSSLGATLSFIERTLRQDVYSDLQVVPNM